VINFLVIRKLFYIIILSFYFICVSSCIADENYKAAHIFVSLCDNQHQKIVPVPAELGNGDDPARNLYWGALYGVKTYFNRSDSWKLIQTESFPDSSVVLERCIFKHKSTNHFLVCDAYKGKEIKNAIKNFLYAAAGEFRDSVSINTDMKKRKLLIGGKSDLFAYIGHNGLMDFELDELPSGQMDSLRNTIILACYSKRYFSQPIKSTGIYPLLWTTGLMAPEAYTIHAALEGWVNEESGDQIKERAAQAYNKYQKCGINGARKLFVSGW
jgi:hypothetical protein